MSIWSRITDALSELRAWEPLSAVFEHRSVPPEKTVAFTIAAIALGAKMAKADGRVKRSQVSAFREVFHIGAEDAPRAARVFDMARTDVAGFEEYADRVARMFGPRDPVLFDLLEGLFHIAVADGTYDPAEDRFLARVAGIFGISDLEFARMRALFAPGSEPDPHDTLGVSPEASREEKRAAWRRLVRETHPDRLMARGVPEEAVKMAEKRLIAINRAWERVDGG